MQSVSFYIQAHYILFFYPEVHLSKMLGMFWWTDSLFHVLTAILIKLFHCGIQWTDTCLRSWTSYKRFLFFLLGMCNWRWIWVLQRRGLGSKSQRKKLKLESKGPRRFRNHLGTSGEWHEWQETYVTFFVLLSIIPVHKRIFQLWNVS